MLFESGSKRKIDKKLKLVLRATKNANERKKSPGISDVGKSGKGQGVERRKLKSRSNGKEFDNGGDDDEESVRGNFESGSKRKRIYAKQNENEELNATTKAKNKASSKKQQSKMKANSNNEPSRSIWVSKSREAASSKLPSHELKEMVENESVVKSKRRIKVKEADYNGAEKKGKSKPSPSKLSYKTTQKVAKKAAKGKKKQGDDESNNMEEQPKKKKRIIRLDPYDISNKRLDDGLSAMEPSKDKKKESEKDVEMSKNAQFRAIKPSTSILSYVEDNLLGRRRMIELKRAGYNTELSAPLDNIPLSTSTERERIEENIFRNKLEFFAAAKISSSFPPPDLPEIAFAGRSNVGKSSLLNALTRQWGVARTSDKPGLTQSINFFKLGTKLCLVDLPGYGFAYAKEEVKDAWEELVKEYASTRVGLKRVCLLIDTKWGMKPRDHELIDLMERSRTSYQIVLTKTDVVFPIDVARRAMQIEESLKANKSIVQPIVMVSSKTGAGIRSLRTVLSKIARFAKA